MDIKPPPYPDYKVQSSEVPDEYRVTIWEQPDMPGINPEEIGWGEMTFDLAGVEDAHEAMQWAEQKLGADEGPYSRHGAPVRDREYVLYVRLPDESRYLQIAGWDPTRHPEGKNLRRVKGHP